MLQLVITHYGTHASEEECRYEYVGISKARDAGPQEKTRRSGFSILEMTISRAMGRAVSISDKLPPTPMYGGETQESETEKRQRGGLGNTCG